MICADRMPLYLSGFVEDEKAAYGRALQKAQKKLSYAPIIEFLCEAIVASEAESKITRAALEGLPKRWMDRVRFRGGSSAYLALDVLLRKPIITTSLLMGEVKVSRQAATLAVNQLVQRRIVRRRGKAGRNQVYAAEELISLLSRRFGSDAESALAAGRRAMVGG